jgi:putative molybdopterin biosynthesis protein
MLILTLAHRRLGLITAPGNPLGITSLEKLANPRLNFINRQPGSGTRVWLDENLDQLGVDAAAIPGYDRQAATHSEVAAVVAEGLADAGLGLEAAAAIYNLGFVPLILERYDLVFREAQREHPILQMLCTWLASEAGKQAILAIGGYDTSETGIIRTLD